ncbi:MAG: F0F1 ATP synthase subunit B [Proteobacteria bacterium]|nr:F0F1 ATP synthase subunit B [Pseudomonadota bacterium]
MLIDWFTVFAQIVNFLILIWLLNKFLYGPIIAAMDRREEKIALRLQEAGQKGDEAAKEMALYRQKNEEITKRREEMLSQAREDAERLRKELAGKAREEVGEVRKRWHEAIKQEKDSFLKELKKRAGKQVYAIARRALTDLSDSDLERRITSVFIKQIEGLDKGRRRKLADAIRQSGQTVIISSASQLDMNVKQQITRTVHDHLLTSIDVHYETSPHILCGIELKASGYVLGWNLGEYLKTLEEELSRALEKESAEK